MNLSFSSSAVPVTYYFPHQFLVVIVQDKTHYQSSETQVPLPLPVISNQGTTKYSMS